MEKSTLEGALIESVERQDSRGRQGEGDVGKALPFLGRRIDRDMDLRERQVSCRAGKGGAFANLLDRSKRLKESTQLDLADGEGKVSDEEPRRVEDELMGVRRRRFAQGGFVSRCDLEASRRELWSKNWKELFPHLCIVLHPALELDRVGFWLLLELPLRPSRHVLQIGDRIVVRETISCYDWVL